jgi:F0F1-type ATP synthase assembly protein I
MSGDPNAPSSESERAGQSRQKLPTASPRTTPSEDSNEGRERSSIAKFAGVGVQFAVTILVAVAVGNWVAKKLGSGLYLAVFLGAGAAFYSMYRQLMANLEREEAAKRARKAGQSSARPSNEP